MCLFSDHYIFYIHHNTRITCNKYKKMIDFEAITNLMYKCLYSYNITFLYIQHFNP